jgi:hypothetical protein
MASLVGVLFIILFTFSNCIENSFASELPIVDLGYEKHQALVYNVKFPPTIQVYQY